MDTVGGRKLAGADVQFAAAKKSPQTAVVILPIINQSNAMLKSVLFRCLLCPIIVIIGSNAVAFSQGSDSLVGEIAIFPGVQYVLRNVGSEINTKLLDYSPSVTADGLALYFVSDGFTGGGTQGGHDIFATLKFDPKGLDFSPPTALPPPINSPEHEGVVSISPDGKMFFYTACNRKEGYGDCDIFQCNFDGTNWGDILIHAQLNSDVWDSQPSVAKDGKHLYFVSQFNQPGVSIGEADIWVSKMKEDSTWNIPDNLGKPVNSIYQEDSPCLLHNDSLLIFASNRPGGYGGFDFYTSHRQPDGKWSEPVNLGPFINSKKDDRFISATADDSVLYFSSERTDVGNYGQMDIFMLTRIDRP